MMLSGGTFGGKLTGIIRSGTFPVACLAQSSSRRGVPISIGFIVWMAVWTIRFVGEVMGAMPHFIQHVFAMSSIPQVVQRAIGWIAINMANLHALRWISDKCANHENMHELCSSHPCIAEFDLWVTTRSHDRPKNFAGYGITLPVGSNDNPFERTNMPLVGNFVESFPSDDGQPSFYTWHVGTPFSDDHAPGLFTQARESLNSTKAEAKSCL